MSYTRLYACCLCGVSFKDTLPPQGRCLGCGGYVKTFVMEPQPIRTAPAPVPYVVADQVTPDQLADIEAQWGPLKRADPVTERFAGIDFGAKPSFAEEAMSALSKEIIADARTQANVQPEQLGNQARDDVYDVLHPQPVLETLETAALLAELQRRAGK